VAARDVGFYNAYAADAWNDEELVGSQICEPADFVEKLCRDAEGKPIVDIAKDTPLKKQAELAADELGSGKRIVEEETVETEADDIDVVTGESVRKTEKKIVIPRPLPRDTEADRTNDYKSLNRKLDRSLYLLIKRKDGQWRFPEDRLYGRENLHQVRDALALQPRLTFPTNTLFTPQAAERILIQAGGINMNTWVIANHPVGHFVARFAQPILNKILPNRRVQTSPPEAFEQEEYGERVFFMKTRIMTGQLNLAKNEYGDEEFQWLTKEEIVGRVSEDYWHQVRNMLAER
jgi:large subunit ribosomal protein L46